MSSPSPTKLEIAHGYDAIADKLGMALSELPGWFDQHVKGMDTMMVSHMRENGFTLIESPSGQVA